LTVDNVDAERMCSGGLFQTTGQATQNFELSFNLLKSTNKAAFFPSNFSAKAEAPEYYTLVLNILCVT